MCEHLSTSHLHYFMVVNVEVMYAHPHCPHSHPKSSSRLASYQLPPRASQLVQRLHQEWRLGWLFVSMIIDPIPPESLGEPPKIERPPPHR